MLLLERKRVRGRHLLICFHCFRNCSLIRVRITNLVPRRLCLFPLASYVTRCACLIVILKQRSKLFRFYENLVLICFRILCSTQVYTELMSLIELCRAQLKVAQLTSAMSSSDLVSLALLPYFILCLK